MVLSSSSFSLWSSIFFICLPSDLVWREEKIHVAIPSPSHLRPAKAHICPCAAIFISSTCEISPRESVSSVRADSGPKRVNYLTYVEWITWMASDYTVLFSHLTCVFFSLSLHLLAFSLICSTGFRQSILPSTFLAYTWCNDATDVFARVQRCTMATYVSIRMSATPVRRFDGVYLPMQRTHVAHCKYDGLAFKRRHISYFNIYNLRWIYLWKFRRWRCSVWAPAKVRIKCLNAIPTKSQNVNRFVVLFCKRAMTLVSALGRTEFLAAGRPMCSLGNIGTHYQRTNDVWCFAHFVHP